MKKKRILILGSICALFIFGIVMTVGEYEDHNSQLPLLTLEEFELMLNSGCEGDAEKYIYVGRDSCPSCALVYPTLCSIKKEYDLNIFYYSTEPDREIRAEKMYALLEQINIDYVPSVAILSQGTIRSVIDGEKFVNQFVGGGKYD